MAGEKTRVIEQQETNKSEHLRLREVTFMMKGEVGDRHLCYRKAVMFKKLRHYDYDIVMRVEDSTSVGP